MLEVLPYLLVFSLLYPSRTSPRTRTGSIPPLTTSGGSGH
jgi:hypothetical protein